MTLSPARTPWHSLSPQDCLDKLDAADNGLSEAQCAERLARVGLNRLELAAGRSNLRILWDQLSNVMLIMLLAVAAVSAGVAFIEQRFPKDAIAIVLIVGLNALLGFLQEARAQKALLALREMAQPLVTVLRDGEWRRLPSEHLVPGDLMRVEAGDRVPADARLLESVELGLREAALTGIEAISDSVAAFRPVEWRNARRVLAVMVAMLALMFSGISALAHQSGVVYVESGPTLLYQLGGRIFGDGPLLALLQLATLLILLLAANTAYADFPRLAAFLARDGFLPRQLASLGDRLVFSNGIYALSGFAALLLIVFQGSVSQLIPLYAVGVFLSFTLSQTGMVVHWWKQRAGSWQTKALVNGLGALITAVVTVVLLVSKFTHGAWLVVLAIPLLVAIFLRIRTHYNHVARRLRLAKDVRLKLPPPPPSGGTPTVVLVGQLHRGTFEAIRFARTISSELVAVHVDLGTASTQDFRDNWRRQVPEVKLEVLDSPYRSLVDPVVEFVKGFELEHRKDRDRFCVIVLPVFVTRHRWENLLHNQSTILLRNALRAQGTRVVTTVGFYL